MKIEAEIPKYQIPKCCLLYQCVLFNFNSSWFSKFFELSLPLFAEKMCPAVLKSRSQAADAGKGVLSLSDNLRSAGTDFRMSIDVTELAI